MDRYAHWVGERGDRSVVVDTGSVQGVEKVNEPVIYEFFQVKDELTNCSRDFSRVVPPENVYDGALIDRVVRVDYLGTRETKEGIDGDEDDAEGIAMNGTSPLKVMVCSDGERRTDESFPEGGEGVVIGLVNEG